MNFFREIAENMIASKPVNYQQEIISKYKIKQFHHLQHSNFYVLNHFQQKIKASLFSPISVNSHSCILYLHGYGSNKLEGLSLLSDLPINLSLCCFDFSGSGKSEGNISTYGYKQCEDIKYMLKKLKLFGYTEFVLWGRSMGAVASLLYTEKNDDKSIRFQVVDSPFHSFESIAKYYAKKKMNIPDLIIYFLFEAIKGHCNSYQFNPFKINTEKAAKECKVPALFVYSENDKMIESASVNKIINSLNPYIRFEKLIIEEGHNHARSKETLNNIFSILQNYLVKNSTHSRKKKRKGLISVLSQKNFLSEKVYAEYVKKNKIKESLEKDSVVKKKQTLKLASFSFCFRQAPQYK